MRPFSLLCVLVLFSSGCRCGAGAGDEGSGGGQGTDSGTRATGGGGQASGGGGGQATGGGGTTGSAEICDGIDNDNNGIIDDVDVGMDGVCDCLKIATLGFAGQWGTGSVFANWLNGKSLSGAVSLGAQTLTEPLLAPYQIIVVQDVRSTGGQPGVGNGLGRAFSAEEVEVLRAWVAKGGGLMTLIGYGNSSEVTNVNTLLAPYGLSYGTTGILPAVGGSTVPVTHWATHPLSDGIIKIGIDNGYAVLGAGTAIGWEPAMGQSDVGRALEYNSGHVFVWADEWITYDSEWTLHPDYQVARFWLNSLKWLTVVDRCQVSIPVIN